MKIGILSDAHGNPYGLKACLNYLTSNQKVDRIYFLGDAVGYMSAYNEILDLLKVISDNCILGNHDAMLLGMLPIDDNKDRVYQIIKNRSMLQSHHYEMMKNWPMKLEVVLEKRRLLMVHGSPSDPMNEYIYPDTDISQFEALGFDAVFLGHTHRPFIRSTKSTLVVNPGSCGLPRDHGALASCAIYDSASHSAQILRIPLPVDEILDYFEHCTHSAVSACFKKVSPENIVGRIIES